MKTNSISWNPMEAYIFSVANEDTHCYTFDMRNLDHYVLQHSDHLNAVIDIDYSPTGKEFVSGSYDKHLRIFPLEYVENSRSREVYHTARMNRIFSVLYSADSTFLFSGSDDTNIRLWKTNASMPLRPLSGPEKEKFEYVGKLKEKFKAFPEIRKIATHKQLSKRALIDKRKKHLHALAQKRAVETVKDRLPEDPVKRRKLLKRVLPDKPVLASED